jgi:poly(3-hydroxybutyrate) depolymerase
MSGDSFDHDGLDGQLGLSRRDFTKAAGGAAMLAAASDPAAADAERGTERVTPRSLDALPPVGEAFTPSDWYVVGPFQYQRRDTEVGWLFPTGGEDTYASGERTPGTESLQSAFAGGASVEWHRRSASGSSVPFRLGDEIDPTGGDLTPLLGGGGLFDDFQDWHGIGSVLYGKAYAFTTFEVDQPRRAVLETDAEALWLNGHRVEESATGVALQQGTNYLLARQYLIFGRYGGLSVSFRPPEAPVEVNDLAAFRGTPQNAVLPDLVVGERTDLPASVRVTNTTGEEIDSATLRVETPDSGVLVTQEVEVDPPLAPFETRRVNTRIETAGVLGARQASEASVATQETTEVPEVAMASTALGEGLADAEAAERVQAEGASAATFSTSQQAITAEATVSVGGATHSRDLPLRVRDEDETRRQTTFVSRHDESVQAFSYREPTDLGAGRGPYDLVVSLHGANVPSINQAGAYVPRKGTFVLAPGARGPVNYDHEDLGRLDDLEAMDVLAERFDIDEDRVFLTGHSMGGHGTWHVGLTHSGRFAGIAPSAAWTDHETYIGVPFGRDKLQAYPGLKAVKETALQKNLALPKARNAADGTLPAFVLHGGADTSVPTTLPRTYVRGLANLGLDVDGQVGDRHSNADPDAIDVAYLEVPDAGHWWDKGIGKGNDGVNHPDLFGFLTNTARNPYPDHLTFYTTNLAVEHEKQWVAVLRQHDVHAPTEVRAEATADGVELDVENVAVLALDGRAFANTTAGSRHVVVGDDAARVPAAETVYLDLTDGVEVLAGRPRDDGRKTPDQYGPMKAVHHSPYRLVYGTQGSDRETAVNRNLANVRSQRLVSRARAPAPVVPDTAIDRATMADYNLVLFGRPASNAVLADLQGDLPITVGDGSVAVGDHRYHGDLAVEYVHPNPRASDNLVQVSSGTSLAGVRLSRARDWTPTQTATADYAVYDDTVHYRKWGACRAAGFFDGDWELADDRGVLRETRG